MAVPKKIAIPSGVALVSGVLLGALLPLGISGPLSPNPADPPGNVEEVQGGPNAGGQANGALSDADLAAANSSLAQAVSDYRKNLGQPVVVDGGLAALAQQDAQAIVLAPEAVNTVVGGKTLMQRIKSGDGFPGTTAASEIVVNGGAGSGASGGFMKNIQADPVARAILDDPNWDSFGLSVTNSPSDGVYVVVIFAKEQ
jgi:uncharacterized protein YkwD